ncbi:hypothetical protein LV82_02187 [Albidovulum inexpectatum]|uniref:Uncharacterized protein n=1 Tax=Albidovulum inexpectatum TaxID=196587 RepID=A0A2S5JFP6_9RHOB|nr:hypothetical protein [Albidovulum inexpectatum]PPB80312.1 hypothetical protein LV82_02187 [Albidovulum inexpectatum]
MRILAISLGLVSAVVLSGCMQTDGERALAGAAAGALVADATDNNVVAGAALGGAAGALCDDMGVCRNY